MGSMMLIGGGTVEAMNYRMLGKTGIRISEVGFGCGDVGGIMIRGSYKEQVVVVKAALDLGINYFDTAPAYGDGLSESNLGMVLDTIEIQPLVSTKVTLRWQDMSDIRGAVQRSVEASLSRLRRSSVDVIQLHTQISSGSRSRIAAETIDLNKVLGPHGVADAFDTIRSMGLARFAGFTAIGDTSALLKVIDSGRFDVLQAYYNLLNPSAGISLSNGFVGQDFQGIINRAEENGIGVIGIRVLAGGALCGAIARSHPAARIVAGSLVSGAEYDEDARRAKKLGFLLGKDVTSLSQAAVRFALMHPGVSTVLLGFSHMYQVYQATGCSDAGPMSVGVLERLRKLWESDFGTHTTRTA